MTETATNPLAAILFLVLIVLFALWGNKRISESKQAVKEAFATFEKNLRSSVSGYQAYTNNHPYVWGEADYKELYQSILDSARWSLRPNSAWPHRASEFSLRVDEERMAIYVAIGYSDFDWSSLYHYQEWLQSMADVGEAIKKHKESERRA